MSRFTALLSALIHRTPGPVYERLRAASQTDINSSVGA